MCSLFIKITEHIYKIDSQFPQRSILNPVLYTSFTLEYPIADNILTATYVDDKKILYSFHDPFDGSCEQNQQSFVLAEQMKH